MIEGCFPLLYFAAAGEKLRQQKYLFRLICRWTKLCSPYSRWKFPSFVSSFVDGAKKQLIKIFGGEIFRQRPRNMWVENRLNTYIMTVVSWKVFMNYCINSFAHRNQLIWDCGPVVCDFMYLVISGKFQLSQTRRCLEQFNNYRVYMVCVSKWIDSVSFLASAWLLERLDSAICRIALFSSFLKQPVDRSDLG